MLSLRDGNAIETPLINAQINMDLVNHPVPLTTEPSTSLVRVGTDACPHGSEESKFITRKYDYVQLIRTLLGLGPQGAHPYSKRKKPALHFRKYHIILQIRKAKSTRNLAGITTWEGPPKEQGMPSVCCLTRRERQINIRMGSYDVQEVLDFHNQQLAMDELMKVHEKNQNIESLYPVHTADRMMAGNWTEDLGLIEKGLKKFLKKYRL
ncbi:hypothetical protein TNCV_4046661 [Trichonephila clavipes]|nr:hypothetical protein TNCV_4046661 [Trichonephila clavipes]